MKYTINDPGNGSGNKRVVIVGANGGIGSALTNLISGQPGCTRLYALSRIPVRHFGNNVTSLACDTTNEAGIIAAAHAIEREGAVDTVIIATGKLHGDNPAVSPEKDWKQLDPLAMAHVFAVNTIGPALVMKHFAPLLPKEGRSVMAALSARVGSISDNRLGGWYSYRASKAALNQFIRTFSIELARKRKDAIVLGLHPGTVATGLSEPFQSSAYERFTPEQSAEFLLAVIDNANTSMTGKVYDWNGKPVPE